MLVWTDLETTGLDEEHGSILEIAVVVTDHNLQHISTRKSLVRPLFHRYKEAMDAVAMEMHTKNGLIEAIDAAVDSLPTPEQVAADLAEWVQKLASEMKVVLRKVPLCGSSVHFDKKWMRKHMLAFEDLFSHRIVDVSSFNIGAKLWAPTIYRSRPGADDNGENTSTHHRAHEDILDSIDTARHYKEHLFAIASRVALAVAPRAK